MFDLRMAVIVVLCSVPDVAYCAELNGVPTGTLFFKTAAILASVCLLAVATLRWVLPRVGRARVRPDSRMRLLERIDLGGSASLVLVDIDGHTLLVGHTPNSMQVLQDTPGDVSRETPEGMP